VSLLFTLNYILSIKEQAQSKEQVKELTHNSNFTEAQQFLR